MTIYNQSAYNIVKRQLSVNWDKFVSKKIDRTEYNRRNEITINWFLRKNLTTM